MNGERRLRSGEGSTPSETKIQIEEKWPWRNEPLNEPRDPHRPGNDCLKIENAWQCTGIELVAVETKRLENPFRANRKLFSPFD